MVRQSPPRCSATGNGHTGAAAYWDSRLRQTQSHCSHEQPTRGIPAVCPATSTREPREWGLSRRHTTGSICRGWLADCPRGRGCSTQCKLVQRWAALSSLYLLQWSKYGLNAVDGGHRAIKYTRYASSILYFSSRFLKKV